MDRIIVITIIFIFDRILMFFEGYNQR